MQKTIVNALTCHVFTCFMAADRKCITGIFNDVLLKRAVERDRAILMINCL